jgi:hypothetical protein
VDPDCRHAGLSFARAVTAVELERSALLAGVVARHLDSLAQETAQGWEKPALDWLLPLLQDTTAQCLLVNSLASPVCGPEPPADGLWQRLLPLYRRCRAPEPVWPQGPLAACCALGLALSEPSEQAWLKDLRQRVQEWPGWKHENDWPTRHPGKSLENLPYLLTERALVSLKLPDRKLWKLDRLKELLGTARQSVWPPLLSFCFVGSGPRK